jgi:hypothetical protein
MDGLSPETRALLDRASEGDRLDDVRREALRRSTAAALGISGPAIPRRATSAHGASSWALRAFGALAATGAVVAVVAQLHSSSTPRPVARPIEAASSAARVHMMGAPAPVDALGAFEAGASGAAGMAARVSSAPESPSTTATTDRPTSSGDVTSRRRDSLTEHPAKPREDALAAETRLVASAQSALDHGQSARALEWLDEHDRRFPDGPLAPESEALRLDALCTAGRARDARAEAVRWNVSHPTSPRRLPASCGHDVE